jgi:hypothetical protein
MQMKKEAKGGCIGDFIFKLKDILYFRSPYYLNNEILFPYCCGTAYYSLQPTT